MDAKDEASTPVLDEWIAEVGEEAVAASARAAVADVENGTAPDLIDAEGFSAYTARRRQRPAS